jgi:hypothetical protein
MPKIFICYRHDDASMEAAWIRDQLVARFGERDIFLDIDTIPRGVDFRRAIDQQVGQCDYLIAVIGKAWLTICDEAGHRRLDNPDDWVRLEIKAALNRDVSVVPVLWHGVKMPEPNQLPEELREFAYRQAHAMQMVDRQHDLQKLIEDIDRQELGRSSVAEKPVGREGRQLESSLTATSVPKVAATEQRAKPKSRLAIITLSCLAAVALAGALSWWMHGRSPAAGQDGTGTKIVDERSLVLPAETKDQKQEPVAGAPAGGPASSGAPSPATPAKASVAQAVPQSRTPVRTTEGDLYRDTECAIEFRRPSTDWEFISSPQAIAEFHLGNGGLVGLLNYKLQSYGAVLVRPTDEGLSLSDSVDLFLDTSPLQDRKNFARREMSVDGRPAVEVKFTAAPMPAINASYFLCLIENGGLNYVILGWTIGPQIPEALEADLHKLLSSVHFLPSRPKLPDSSLATPPGQGADWVVQANRYENASYRFRLTIGSGWAFDDIAAIVTDSPGLCASLSFPAANLQQLYGVETIGDLDHKGYARFGDKKASEGLPLPKNADLSEHLEIAGLPATEEIFRNVPVRGVKYDVARTSFFNDRTAFRVLTLWPASRRAAADEQLRASYRFLSFLTGDEAVELQEKLTRDVEATDPDNVVGPTYCLRRGVFTDFENQFQFKKPDGVWTIRVGDEAKKQMAHAILMLTSPADGISVAVAPESLSKDAPEVSNQEFHERMLRMRAPGSSEPRTTSTRLNDLDVRISEWKFPIGDDFELAFALVTTVRDRRQIAISFFGFSPTAPRIAQLIPTVVGGLSLPKEFSAANGADVHDNVLEESRLGYRLSAPAGWTIRRGGIGGLESLASASILSRVPTPAAPEECFCGALVICSPQFSTAFALNGILHSPGVSPFGFEKRRERKDQFAGLSAKRFDFLGHDGDKRAGLSAWIARRGNTMYLFFVMRQLTFTDTVDSATVEPFKQFFTLLP